MVRFRPDHDYTIFTRLQNIYITQQAKQAAKIWYQIDVPRHLEGKPVQMTVIFGYSKTLHFITVIKMSGSS